MTHLILFLFASEGQTETQKAKRQSCSQLLQSDGAQVLTALPAESRMRPGGARMLAHGGVGEQSAFTGIAGCGRGSAGMTLRKNWTGSRGSRRVVVV